MSTYASIEERAQEWARRKYPGASAQQLSTHARDYAAGYRARKVGESRAITRMRVALEERQEQGA